MLLSESDLGGETHGETDFQKLSFPYVRHPDQDGEEPARHRVVVVGAGPVGLALAIDLAQRGIGVVLLDNDDRLSTGSRAICFAKRTLEIFDRLGCGDRMVDKGVSWGVGRVFFGEEQVFEFNLLPETGHARPAFINLQQYYVEGYLAERAMTMPLIDIRWRNEVREVENTGDHVTLTVNTPDGDYRLHASYLVACDGSRSGVRRSLGLEATGRQFKDRFLIADVKMKSDRPAERWFWFDPSFHPNQSVLLHRQPDNVWRIDFQLGWDADPEEERRPEKIIPRVRALLGEDTEFDLEWASVYTFSCLRMEKFRHGRVFFAGDSAHGVSPFGARGANSGVQDAENLAWKLAAVLDGGAPDALLDSYGNEREYAADENIRHSTRATDFITPKSEISKLFRNSVLELSRTLPFARSLVNSGRLSVPATLEESPLITADRDEFTKRARPGSVAPDAPLSKNKESEKWLLGALGENVSVIVFGEAPELDEAIADAAAESGIAIKIIRIPIDEAHAIAVQRYDARPGTTYLIRPDQHIVARWRCPSKADIRNAISRTLCT